MSRNINLNPCHFLVLGKLIFFTSSCAFIYMLILETALTVN